jgi:hypothetical protein
VVTIPAAPPEEDELLLPPEELPPLKLLEPLELLELLAEPLGPPLDDDELPLEDEPLPDDELPVDDELAASAPPPLLTIPLPQAVNSRTAHTQMPSLTIGM